MGNRFPQPLSNLIQAFGQLPGIGPRSAERIALEFLHWPLSTVQDFSNALVKNAEQIDVCGTCGCFSIDQECGNCADSTESKDASIICIVEKPTDIFSLEKFKAFDGSFHALGGKISPTSGVDPEDLLIEPLITRIEKQKPTEIIFGLASDLESEATIYYLTQQIKACENFHKGLRLTRLASGMPAGSALEFTDGLTLQSALDNRTVIE